MRKIYNHGIRMIQYNYFLNFFLLLLFKYFCKTTNQNPILYYVGVVLFIMEAAYKIYCDLENHV
jgi:hypothetical protein